MLKNYSLVMADHSPKGEEVEPDRFGISGLDQPFLQQRAKAKRWGEMSHQQANCIVMKGDVNHGIDESCIRSGWRRAD